MATETNMTPIDNDDEPLCPECNRPLDEWSECQVCISGDEGFEGWPEEDVESTDPYPEREEDEPDYAN